MVDVVVCTTVDVDVATVVAATYPSQLTIGRMLVSHPIASSWLQPETEAVAITQAKFIPWQEAVPPSPLLGAAGLVYTDIQEERGVGPDVSGGSKETL